MSRRKTTLVFLAAAGALLGAEALTLGVAVQTGAVRFDGWVLPIVAFVLVASGLLLALLVATFAHRVLLKGVDESCSRLEASRASAHLELLSVVPTIDLLGRALRRQNGHFAELRESLLSGAIEARSGALSGSVRVARAAGLAAGMARTNEETIRLISLLDEWLEAARARHEDVRSRTAEVRMALDCVPERSGAAAADSDPVFGYSVAEGSPAFSAEAWAELPAALRARLTGSIPDDETTERN